MSGRPDHDKRYGRRHRALRAAWRRQVEAGLVTCWRCGRPIHPTEPFDLGHADYGDGYAGPEHSLCNRRAGGSIGARITNNGRATANNADAVTIRDW